MFEGEDGLNEESGEISEGSMNAASVGARISTVFAGPLFNFILAFILGIILVGLGGTDLPVIQEVMEDFPAQEAGMLPGDVIVSMNGEKIKVAREITLNTFRNQGEPVEIGYMRDGTYYETVIQPLLDEQSGRFLIGWMGYSEYTEPKGFEIFKFSFYEVRYSLKATLKSLGMLLEGKATKDDVAGPVGIAQVIGEVARESSAFGSLVLILNLCNIALLLSVNLGVMNLLPFPALDGGRLVFLLLEGLRGKPIPPDKEGMVHFAGFVVLMIVMVFVLYNDIVRLFA